MKRINLAIFTQALLLAFFAIATVALAQESTSTETDTSTNNPSDLPPEIREISDSEENHTPGQIEASGKIQKRQEAFEENLAERRAALQARTQERIINLSANISNRMESAITRLENISNRLDSRIQKLNDLGIKTTESEQSLADARKSIEEALGLMKSIDDKVATVVTSENAHTDWVEIKNIYTTTKQHLSEALVSLRDSVAQLKKAVLDASTGSGTSEAIRSDDEQKQE